jgi:hypothetical protein
MKEYIKPNVLLPISLHDARVTKVIVENPISSFKDGILILEFEDGFFKVDEKEVYHTGKSSIEISGVDYDFSHVYYCEENNREEVEFVGFMKDVEESSFEIIDETYGYNQTKFRGSLFLAEKWVDVEVEIYHFNMTLYRWEK